MADHTTPPGWNYNPSAWRERLPVLLLALAGGGIATYLTLYQVGVLTWVWEPFFGNGSKHVLIGSSVARLLPVPDASLGAFAYLLEAVFDAIGREDRWRSRPWAVLLLGLTGLGLAFGGIALVLCQAFLVGAFCTLCLASAGCSLLLAAGAADEVWATLQHLQGEMRRGRSFWRAVWGEGAAGTSFAPR